jgi:23S rRNA (uracil1939-C5)-methyltransferase
MQNHPKVSLQLYRDVVEKIERLCPKKPMFDLYSGIGILSQLIAKQGHEVDAIEGNPEAIQMAKKSAAFNKIDSVQFYAASVEQFLHRTKKDVPLWIVNPPRTGLSPDVVEQIQKKGPEYLIYISCNPTTLSRDLAQLSRFEIASIQGYDMFPQTTHFETVVFAKKIRR